MNSNYEFVCTIKSDDVDYRIFRKLDDGTYVKVYFDIVEELDETEKIAVKLSDYLKKQEKEKIVKARKKAAFRGLVGALVCSSGLSIGAYLINKNYPNYVEYVFEKNDMWGAYSLFYDELYANETLSDINKEQIYEAIRPYFLEAGNSDKVISIALKLRNLDGSKFDGIIVEFLEDIFNFRNGKYIANELYNNYIGKYSDDARVNAVSAYLNMNPHLLIDVLNGKKVSFLIDSHVTFVDLDNLNNNDPRIFAYIDKAVKDRFGEQTEIVNMMPKISSNVFNNTYRFYLDIIDVAFYYEYVNGRVLSVSDEVYYKKLYDIILKNGESIDINNSIDRNLLYLYADSLVYNNGEINTDDIAASIYSGMKIDDEFRAIDCLDFVRYLESGSFNYSNLYRLYKIAYLVKDDNIDLLQEVNLALKLEIINGNITQEEYNLFMSNTLRVLESNPAARDKFIEANMYDTFTTNEKLSLIIHL